MQALEQSWFAAADRDSDAAAELEALEHRPEPEFIKLKVALACVVAAFTVLLFPAIKPAAAAAEPMPRRAAPVLVAMARAPEAPKAKAQTKPLKKKPGAAKHARRRH